MDRQSADLIMSNVVSRYRATVADTVFLGGFCNQVYECTQQGQQYILRISTEPWRTVEMVHAEIDWLRYLADRGLSVARAVPSRAGNWVEVVEVEGKSVPVVVFEKAPGQPPEEKDWNEQLFLAMGRFLGRMHCLTREYTPDNAAYRRYTWREDMDRFADLSLLAADKAIQEKHQELHDYLARLPQAEDAYGLVHVDFHRGNFFIHGENLTLFDFDDCQYSWFADDLAMALFYAIWPGAESEEKRQIAQKFYATLLDGYHQENHIEAHWLREIPYFLRRREISLYMVMTSLGEAQWGEKVKQFMRGRRERILSNVPYVDIAFLEPVMRTS